MQPRRIIRAQSSACRSDRPVPCPDRHAGEGDTETTSAHHPEPAAPPRPAASPPDRPACRRRFRSGRPRCQDSSGAHPPSRWHPGAVGKLYIRNLRSSGEHRLLQRPDGAIQLQPYTRSIGPPGPTGPIGPLAAQGRSIGPSGPMDSSGVFLVISPACSACAKLVKVIRNCPPSRVIHKKHQTFTGCPHSSACPTAAFWGEATHL